MGNPRCVKYLSLVLFVGLTMSFPIAVEEEEGATEVELRLFADGFAAPLGVIDPPDNSGRIFVIDQPGYIWIVENGEVLDEPFLDVSDSLIELDENYDERGLLGLAFHPDYASNGRFFVHYSGEGSNGLPDEWDHTAYVSEFTVSDDPNVADPGSEREILLIDQPYHNHNGGPILFGPDGYLYIPLGDGGNGGDIDAEGDDRGRPDEGWAQNLESILGAILRIDIDNTNGEAYGIPADNPLIDVEEIPNEVWAYGFRNPYGMSFDPETGDAFVADAGQALFEEVSLVVPGGNHGWNIKEGTHCFDPNDFVNPPETCPDEGARGEPLIDPVIEYARGPDTGSVIIPGVMSRDSSMPALQDRFVFGDYATIRFIPTGVLYAATPQENGLWDIERLHVRPGGNLGSFLLGVNQDSSGRLYVLTTQMGGPTGTTGEIYTISDPSVVEGFPWVEIMLIVAGVVLVGALLIVAATRRMRTRSGSEP